MGMSGQGKFKRTRRNGGVRVAAILSTILCGALVLNPAFAAKESSRG